MTRPDTTRRRRRRLRAAAWAGVALLAGPAAAGEAPEGAAADAAMQEMMAKMQPGPMHQRLAFLEGTWKVAYSMWQTSGGPEEKGEATSVYRWILGGRYLVSEFHSTYQGMPFEGRSLEGYDNFKDEYFALWIDNFGTGVVHQTGTIDGDVIRASGAMYDPMKGKQVVLESITEKLDDDHFRVEMYARDGDERRKIMAFDYTRQ